MKDDGFKMAKERSRRYPAQTITDADYADDIAQLANTPTQTKIRLHSLERAAAGIGLYVNAERTEYICFNQRGNIFTLNGSSLKLVDKFTYRGKEKKQYIYIYIYTRVNFETHFTQFDFLFIFYLQNFFSIIAA